MAKAKEVRISLTVPAETKEALEELADENGKSVAATIKQLIGDGLVVAAVKREGGRIILQAANGKEYLISGPDFPKLRLGN